MNEITPKDYVVASHGGKPCLIRVLRLVDDTVFGVWEYKDQETKVEVPIEDVRANLGRHPHIGTVYGAKTERLIDVEELEPFFQLEWFFEPGDKEKAVILKGVNAGVAALKKVSLHRILSACSLRVVLNTAKNPSGKTVLGTYKTRRGNEEDPDIITIRHHNVAVDLYPYLLAHEAGHGIWHRILPTGLKLRWLKAFLSRSEVSWYTHEEVSAVVKAVVSQATVYPELDERGQGVLAEVMYYIRETTGLRSHDVAFLLEHDLPTAKTVLGPWREWSTAIGVRDTLVTEYSNLNVDEFFSECVANRVSGRGLPDYLKTLWKDTLEEIENKRPAVQREED